MTQLIVYNLIKELGGQAFQKQIKDLMKLKYPGDETLYNSIPGKLARLYHNGYIDYEVVLMDTGRLDKYGFAQRKRVRHYKIKKEPVISIVSGIPS